MSTELFTTPAATPLVEISALDVTYRDGLRAVEGISFSLRAGEFVAVVGPSGCGKSTLLRSIAGLVRPSRGSLTVAGLEPVRARREATRMSFVFQDPTLLPWRNVYHNIALPLELAGEDHHGRDHHGRDHHGRDHHGRDHHGRDRRGRDARVRRAVELVGLADFSGSYPAELSGGMRMRVSLARAVVTDPALLLLDEPFAALDDITRQTLNEELLSLWESRHWTGIFVTHNIAEAIFLSQRVLVLSRRPGRVVADVAVTFPYPRADSLRSQADFARLTGEIAAHLREASR
jgi:NitT/TauT family transport system ATP-binding protein